jgi:hypothetical protein
LNNDLLEIIIQKPVLWIYTFHYKAAYLITIIIAFALLLYFYELFKDDFFSITKKLFILVPPPLLLFILFTPIHVYTRFLPVFQVMLIGINVFTAIAIFKAVKNKRDNAWLVFTGLILFLLAMVNDVLYTNRMIYTINTNALGFLIIVVFQSIILSRNLHMPLIIRSIFP